MSDLVRITPPNSRQRLLRVIWAVVYWSMFRFSPRPLHAWRCFLLRLFGAKVGKGAHPYPSCKIWAPWNLTLGSGSCLAGDVICYSVADIKIGDFAIVSQGSHLCSASHDYNTPEFHLIGNDIIIETKAWVAAEVFVGPGVRVGEGAMLAARAVVVKDVLPWTIVGGNPAKAIKMRTPFLK